MHVLVCKKQDEHRKRGNLPINADRFVSFGINWYLFLLARISLVGFFRSRLIFLLYVFLDLPYDQKNKDPAFAAGSLRSSWY